MKLHMTADVFASYNQNLEIRNVWLAKECMPYNLGIEWYTLNFERIGNRSRERRLNGGTSPG
jgi:hypothetical protein